MLLNPGLKLEIVKLFLLWELYLQRKLEWIFEQQKGVSGFEKSRDHVAWTDANFGKPQALLSIAKINESPISPYSVNTLPSR